MIYIDVNVTSVLFLRLSFFFQMEVELPIKKSDGGYKAYYGHKIENLQVVISEKMQDLRRLQAQRNQLNAKGIIWLISWFRDWVPDISRHYGVGSMFEMLSSNCFSSNFSEK